MSSALHPGLSHACGRGMTAVAGSLFCSGGCVSQGALQQCRRKVCIRTMHIVSGHVLGRMAPERSTHTAPYWWGHCLLASQLRVLRMCAFVVCECAVAQALITAECLWQLALQGLREGGRVRNSSWWATPEVDLAVTGLLEHCGTEWQSLGACLAAQGIATSGVELPAVLARLRAAPRGWGGGEGVHICLPQQAGSSGADDHVPSA